MDMALALAERGAERGRAFLAEPLEVFLAGRDRVGKESLQCGAERRRQ